MDGDSQISVDTALRAMILFWDEVYRRTGSEHVGDRLSDLSLLSDGTTADPAAFHDFVRSIELAQTPEGREAVMLRFVS